MASWGEGAARGLESGFRLALDVQRGQRAEAQQDLENKRQATLDARAQNDHDFQRKRTQQTNDLADLDQRSAMLTAHGKALNLTNPDEQTMRKFEADHAALTQARSDVLAGKGNTYDPDAPQKAAAARVAALSKGDLSVLKEPGSLATTVTNATGHPMADFLRGPNGEPAPIEQGAAELQQGMADSDPERAVRGANVLFKPELSTGIGTPGAQGGTIVGKRIIGLQHDPNSPPDDPQVVPMIRVYVNNGNTDNSGDEIRTRRQRLDKDSPEHATGHYDTFVTQNRSADPQDPVKPISIKAAMDKVGQQQQLVEMLNSPDGQKMVAADGTPQPYDRKGFDTALLERGIERPKPVVDEFTLKQGDKRTRRLIGRDGKVIPGSTTVDEGDDKEFRDTPEQSIRNIMKDNPGMSFLEAGKLAQSIGMTRQPTRWSDGGPGLSAGGAADGDSGNGLSKDAERLVKAQQASIKIDGERMDKGFANEETRIERKYEADTKNVSSSRKAAAEAERAAAMKDLDARRAKAAAEVTSKIDKLQQRLDVTVAPGASMRDAMRISPADQAARDKDRPAILQAELDKAQRSAATATDPEAKERAAADVAALQRELGSLRGAGKRLAPAGLPKGAVQIGTSGGKPVFQTPDGKKFIQS